uniref:ubinuclein-1 isoform X2 n=1 Tax=Erigeron canadensis TaxID=72917 RepID=UPI001CB99842|nr:ubinuclein-1 isoform X2 [Erigeron canadensis]
MEDGGTTGKGSSSSSSPPVTVLHGGGRQRFEIELRPGETTIVSWKKCMKEANKIAAEKNENNNNNENENNNNNNKNKNIDTEKVVNSVSIAGDQPQSVAVIPSALDSRIAPSLPGDKPENEGNDAPPGSRFSAVIEKIERLYMGKNSSDEEDLNDVPDDDEYDTDDSFIDDAELDDYFQVDNSAIKHDGFFVNRGKLERMNEPAALPVEQPKKRRRKDLTKGFSEDNDGNVPNKHMKVSKKEGKKLVTSVDKNSTTPSRSITSPNVNSEGLKYQSPIIALGTVVKKPSDSKNLTDPSPTRVYNGEAKQAAKKVDKQKTGALPSKKHGSKLKDGSPSPALPSQRTIDKGTDVQPKSQGQMPNSEELNQSALSRERDVTHQQADTKASEIAQQPKTPQTARKEGSSTKPKGTSLMLEKAIRDLEKTVAEIRPASMEVPEADNASQVVKRRMPPEIKQKLAKVARVAHTIYGKLSKELLNRLMSILGHLIQIRSLKRNLQNMVEMGLTAKQEKDAKLQQLKKEVIDMVKIRAPLLKVEAIEQQAGSSDDFQETSTKEKVKNKFTTDEALEDKICDLYDQYVDGLDEDAGPQLRKLYVELAELWPKGCMDNHGIKRAICRAKERRKSLQRRKDQENIMRKKLPAPKAEAITVDPAASRVQHPSNKLVNDSSAPIRSISNTMASNTAAQPPNSVHTDKPKQEKLKGSANNQNKTVTEVVVKKKAKRKPETELFDGRAQPERLTLAQGDEKRKSNKQMLGGPVKSVAQPPVTPASVSAPLAKAPENSSVDRV